MPSKWATYRLGKVCRKIGSGATPRGGASVYLDSGEVALIRSQNIYNDHFSHDGLVYLTRRHAAELANVEVQEDDILLNITGDSVARSCQPEPAVLPARVNQHVAIIRTDPELLWPRFLRYYLVSPAMQARMLSLAGSGATRNALTKGMIEEFEVAAPSDLAEQRSIAAILGSLDDKIELNRQMSRTLESMARAIFKSWFVDFDPVRAKMEGRQPYGMDAETASLFPDSFEESELGLVPKGWCWSKLSTVADLAKTTVTPGRQPGVVWEHYSIPAFDANRNAAMELGGSIKSGKYSVPPGCVLVSKLNPQFPRVWLPDVKTPEFAVCSTEFLPFVAIKPEWRAFLYELMRSEPIQQEIQQHVTGSTGSRQRAKPEEIADLAILHPGGKLVDRFAAVVEPLHTRIQVSLRESLTLAEMRDILIPKLMSGEIRLPEAEKMVEVMA